MKNNIAEYLPEVAKLYPNRRAVIFPQGKDHLGRISYSHLTFAQLEELSNSYAREFRNKGIGQGTRTLMLLKPGLDFIAAVFAVFKTGAVPVLIDPGMGRKNLLNCVRDTAPEALIAISEVHWARMIFRKPFANVKIAFAAGSRPAPPGVPKLENIPNSKENFEIPRTSREDMAAILFTTGSTGPPKGVVYTHEIFITQTELIREVYGAGPDEIDMPAFPLFALFSSAMGMTCVIPDMDPSRPANVNPERIIEAVENQGVTFSFASPALWRRVAEYCIENDIRLTSLKKVLMAGAPVPADLHAMIKKVIAPDGETLVPYGATESLPIANFTGSEMLAETASGTANGKGYCVGYPLPGITIKIIKAINDVIEKWDENLLLPSGETGEIVVKGPVVTPEYFQRQEQSKLAKIADADGKIWHRMGDVGFFDESGRLWFRGRKGHRVITNSGEIYYPVCCEAIFNAHSKVFRSALVGVKGEPALIVEPEAETFPQSASEKESFIKELKGIGSNHEFTAKINQFHFHPSFPVDIRHNAKIFREKLALLFEE